MILGIPTKLAIGYKSDLENIMSGTSKFKWLVYNH